MLGKGREHWGSRLSVQSLVHWDTCCSNWLWMSRSGTGRNNENPLGEPSNQKVQIANLMVFRMCCLQLVAVAGSMHLSSLPGSSIAGFPCVLVHKQRLRPWQHATAVIKGSVRLASVYNFEPRWSLGCRQQGHQRREKTLIFRNQKPIATTTYHS